jgi:hypothetical protein
MTKDDEDLIAGLKQLGCMDRSSDTPVTEQAKDYMLRAANRLAELHARPVKVKPLSWREIDPEHRYVGTGLGFTCEVRRLHKGGWEAVWPQGTKETVTCSGAMLACRNAYFAMVLSYIEGAE